MIYMAYTDTGRNFLRNWLYDGGIENTYPIAVTMGSGITTASVTDTQLEGEIGSATNAGSIYRICPFNSKSVADKEVTYEGVFPSTVGSNTFFGEVGIFNTSGAHTGSLFARATFPLTQKSINEEWSVLYTMKIG